MVIQALIERKRDGGELTAAEWTALVEDSLQERCTTIRCRHCSWRLCFGE